MCTRSSKKQLKKLTFLYLWGKQDKVKCSTIINNINRGGLNMVDIDSFLEALKASWVPRIINNQGKWRANFMQISQKLNISLNYLLNMTFRKIDSIPVISHMNPFCREVLTAYNKCKTIKEFKLLSTNEILQQPLWGNEYFKDENCLMFKNWINKGILNVKDLLSIDVSLFQEKVAIIRKC